MNELPNRLLWYLRQAAEVLATPGVIGLGALAFTAVFHLSYVLPMRAQLAEVKSESAKLRAQSGRKSAAPQPPLSPAEQLQAFYRFFPPYRALPEEMAKLYQAAAAANLAIDQVEYRRTSDREGRLQGYEAIVPVRGPYSSIRAFIAKALADLPESSLDGLNFMRQQVGDQAVEAQLRFTLYLRPESSW